MEQLRLPDRLTIRVGGPTYINLRLRPGALPTDTYNHFGVIVGSAQEVDDVWHTLRALDLVDEPVGDIGAGGRALRFRHLLPAAVEVQWFPTAAWETPRTGN